MNKLCAEHIAHREFRLPQTAPTETDVLALLLLLIGRSSEQTSVSDMFEQTSWLDFKHNSESL